MRGAIADSSVIIALAGIGRLDLLFKLYKPVVVTKAVRREVVDDCAGRPGSSELKESIENGAVIVDSPPQTSLLTLLLEKLGDGEAESIALAAARNDLVLLLDDRDARARARIIGFKMSGVLGVLMLAKKQGLITSLREELSRLADILHFRISGELVSRLLVEVGEEDGD